MPTVNLATIDDIERIEKQVSSLTGHIQQLTRALEAQRRGDMPEWLTVAETAAYMRLTPDTVRRKVRAGHFDTRRDGKNILISRETVLVQSSRAANS